ncbi:MAG: deoxyribodipyrimidine photo-lyase [Cetobacterium sp.]
MFDERINILKKNENINGKYILYWMQESQRTKYNFGLQKAIEISNDKKLPLYVVFNYIENYPEASKRHFEFMLQGLKDVKENLNKKGIKFILLSGDVEKNIIKICKSAECIIWDKSYLKLQREQRKNILDKITVNAIEVESNVVVPVEVVSKKEEYSAKTLRDKYKKVKENFLVQFSDLEYLNSNLKIEEIEKMDLSQKYIPENKEKLDGGFLGGEIESKKILDYFLKENIREYSKKGPDKDRSSKLSLYLHFGQISPLEILLKVQKLENFSDEKESFLEELTIRRELAINFVYYNTNYDKWEGITYNWAYETLKNHTIDSREYLYSLEEFENYKTHDLYWNACQKEMIKTGYMDGYMRMYWCKKILEWSETPEKAYEITIYLNNKYFYDGRDPNSYAGVAWCFGKHDRAWQERKIFGKVRYMNSAGLERKFDMEKYVEKILE